MKECVLFVPHIHECGIKAWHQFLYLGKVEVTDGIGYVSRLLLQRHQAPVFEERRGYVGRLYVNY